MGIHNNFPATSWIKLDGISVTKDKEVYIVKDFKTNLKWIYWSSDTPDQLTASNIMLDRTSGRFLVAINNKGECILPTNEDITISFDGNGVDAIRDHIWGLHEKNEEYGNRFVSLEQNIEGITQTVGQTQEDIGRINENVSRIDQKADNISLSVKDIQKEYTDDKESNELRESLNSAIIKINSNLGIFKSELTDYFKDNEMTDEEIESVRIQLELLEASKTNLDSYIDKVIYVAENNGHSEEGLLLSSAKGSLDNIHSSLVNIVENSIIDKIITPTEITVVIDAFARYNAKVNEIKNTCDDIIILGIGGVITEELSRIDVLSDQIKLSVSKVETDFRDELKSQDEDIQNIDKKYAEIVLNPETGIASKVEHINTQIDGDGGIKHRLQSAEEKITPNSIVQVVKNSNLIQGIESEISYIDQRADSISLEVSKKVGKDNIVSSINQTAESIKIDANKINLNGYVTVSDLGANGTTTIHGNRIATGSIKVDSLSSNNENPIIRLFDNCSIDATLRNEQGQGNSIRLKADNENYIKVQPTGYLEDGTYIGAHTAIFSGFYPNHEVMVFQGNSSWGKIRTTQGILSMHNNGVYYGWNGNTSDNKLAYTSDVDSVRTTATTANNKANSAYNLADSAYDMASGCLPVSSSTYFFSGSHDPLSHESYNLGYGSRRWAQVSTKYIYATNTYASAINNPVATIEEDTTLEGVIDSIIIESPNIITFSNRQSLNDKLTINVCGLLEHESSRLFVGEDDSGNVVVNESSLLALALMEVKKLKAEINRTHSLEEEVATLKNEVKTLNEKINSLTDIVNKLINN